MEAVERKGQARVLECTPKLVPFIQQPQTGTLNLNTQGGYGSHLVHAQCGLGVFLLLPDLYLPLLRPLPTAGLLKKRPHHHLIFVRSLNSLVYSMSSPPNVEPNPPPKTFDNMRLPAYRSSYLGRYHPYPRTRAPAREVVMVCALRLVGYSNMQYRRSLLPRTVCCGK